MTLRTRDQADIVDVVVAFHLNAGVDFVIATDHRSDDGTVEMLESYAREGYLRLLREHGEEVRGQEWRTRMARMAATEYGADWTFSCDGDEFFWPRGGSLKDVLDAVPELYGIVRCPVHDFLVRPDDGAAFWERMTLRLAPRASMNNPAGHRPAVMKVVHRADPTIVLNRGNHAVYGTSLRPLPGWHPIEILHFPIRALAQYERKLAAWGRAFGDRAYGLGYKAHREGRLGVHYAALSVDERLLARGLEEGLLLVDTRLRDVLRELRLSPPPPGEAGTPQLSLSSELRSLSTRPLGPQETVALAADLEVVNDAQLVRLQRRVDLLSAQVASLERQLARRLRRGRVRA